MTSALQPYHQAHILRCLPHWVATLHPDHTRRIVQRARKDYLDEQGQPCSWYAAAAEEDQANVRHLIAQRDAHTKALHAALKGFKSIREFCKPLLEQQLGPDIDVDKAQYIHQPFKQFARQSNTPGFELSAGVTEPLDLRPDGPAQTRSLLEAALGNFEGLDDAWPLDTLSHVPVSAARPFGLDPRTFVEHCRTLDLGQQYQDHLQAIYEGPAKAKIEQGWTQAARHSLKLQASIAQLQALLSAKGRDAVWQLCDSQATPRYGSQTLHCWRFSLFGIPVHGALLLGPNADDQVNPCIVHIPDDPEHPLREYRSLQEAGTQLRQRLVQTSFRQHLIGLADKAQQAELGRRLESALFELADGERRPREKANLHFSTTPLTQPIWPVLYRDHTRRVKSGARTIAVPTADADAKAHDERLQKWLEQGLNVLNVAAFFVPGLDAVMLGVFAYQIMDSVFTGFEAWEEGDTQEALGQLESLAINAAVIAGFAAGTYALKASGFVDALESVWKDGKEVLWQPDMAPYATSAALPEALQADARGLYHHDGKTYLRLDGLLHEVFQDSQGDWRVRHPSEPDAYAPSLKSNGRGAWNLAHEHPHDWDEVQLIRRLSPIARDLDVSDLLAAAKCSATDSDALRRVHLANEAAPARMIDMLQRLVLDHAVDQIVSRVRHNAPLLAYKHFALPELLALPGWPAGHALKVFDGPEPFGAHARLGAAWSPGQVEIVITRAELENGNLCQAVVDQLDDEARQGLLGNTPTEQQAATLAGKLADQLHGERAAIFDSLLGGRHAPLSPAEAALGKQFPGVPGIALKDLVANASLVERQQLAQSKIPLRIAEKARVMQHDARLDRALLGLHRASLANADTLRLKAALLAEHPAASEARILDLASADRPHAARLLGQRPIKPRFQPPTRLADGGIGYPLAGWKDLKAWAGLGQRGIEERRLQRLYPALQAAQRDELLAALRRRGDIGEQITALEREQQHLDQHLRTWVAEAAVEHQGSRERMREIINRAWRRDFVERFTLEDMHVDALPSLPARLDHITRLDIVAIGLQEIPENFLQSFPNLRHLSIRGNPQLRARSLFRALPSARQLRNLDLSENGLTALTLNEREVLTALPELQSLDLQGNPLGQLTGLDQLPRLNRLNLRNCQLAAWPAGLTELMERPATGLRALDLGGNELTEVPDLPRIIASPFVAALERAQDPTSWRFENNHLEQDVAQQLAEQGVYIEAIAWLVGASQARRDTWQLLFGHGEHPYLADLLNGLAISDLEYEPWPMLEQLADTQARARALNHPDLLPALTERVEQIALSFLNAQDNAIADALSSLRVDVSTLAEALATPPHHRRMFNTLRRLYARESVNDSALGIYQRRRAIRTRADEILTHTPDAQPSQMTLPQPDPLDDLPLERILGDSSSVQDLRLRLRDELAEPLQFDEPGPHAWTGVEAPITYTTLDNVEEHVNALQDNSVGRRAWIARHPVWQTYLRTHHAQRFEALNRRWTDVLVYLEGLQEAPASVDDDLQPEVLAGVIGLMSEVLPEPPVTADGQLRPLRLNEGQYLQASNLIPDRLAAEQDALSLELTAAADPNAR